MVNSNFNKWQALSAAQALPANYSVFIITFTDKAINSAFFTKVYYVTNSSQSFSDSVSLTANSKVYTLVFGLAFSSSGVTVGETYYNEHGTATRTSANKPQISVILGMKKLS